ncbi:MULTISPECIES: VWA domain-containing protein [unclassified Novosphingobium]|uniref:vWA domain-containing protein n=1 Tax=unclassified Novosphingobium TaxID=2644732 RepID=UPI0025E30625|nr:MULTISPECIES: VWA domain-containing protein [unclassified Novosphingobium]HQV03605.1 VWA domain-containing protein [Novosphingobium sp.]
MANNRLSRTRQTGLAITLSIAMAMAAWPAAAQDSQAEEEDDANSSIVVTATSVRQGGAQDIRHFRWVSLDGDFLPQTFSLTMEGLMGEHDLTLPERSPCKQTFCLTGAAMPAALPLRPDDKWFVGLGFASNIDAEAYKAEPVSLVIVVDRSGSMSGWPISQVKGALHTLVGKLRKGDRIGIITYGSEPQTHLEMTEFAGNEGMIRKAIDGIEIEGSTAMEEGLEAGYTMAEAELPRSHGKTRVMLFTDENPNVGDTSAEGFIGQAEGGSAKGIGLTTFGVGVHFDAALATKVSSVRGGNLFFVDNQGSAKAIFDREFYNMVSEVAHDIDLALTPPKGYRITGVFGVPDGLMSSAPEGTVKVTIPTAFLSSNGGGIYVTLGKDGAHANLPEAELASDTPLLTGSLRYTDGRSRAVGEDRIAVALPQGEAPVPLRKAHFLVDEFTTLQTALNGYHQGGDKKVAFNLIDGLSRRLDASELPGMQEETKLVGGLRSRAAYVAGFQGEMPKELRPLALKGEWEVVRQNGLIDIARGDTVEFTEDGEFITSRQKGDDVYQNVQVNERQVRLVDVDLVFDYRLQGDRIYLKTPDGGSELILRKPRLD